jgi:hypothetical protein
MPYLSPEDIDCDDFQDADELEPTNDDEQELDEDGDVITYKKTDVVLTGNDRRTRPILTIFEVAALINNRALDLVNNGDPKLGAQHQHVFHDSIKTARLEYLLCPEFADEFVIIRTHPDGATETWHLTEFKYFPTGFKPKYV